MATAQNKPTAHQVALSVLDHVEGLIKYIHEPDKRVDLMAAAILTIQDHYGWSVDAIQESIDVMHGCGDAAMSICGFKSSPSWRTKWLLAMADYVEKYNR